MKKILSLVLAMLMIFSMVPAVFAAEAGESNYQAAIDYLKAVGLYKGTTEGDAAEELVERYQMALFTARMVTGRVDNAYWETDANDSGFTDIDALNAEALGGVCYAAQQGIVNGIGGGEFAPFDNVTYRDAIVMIVRALGFNYPDSGYPWSYINKAREIGVLDGITGVSYTEDVKREVIAQLLYNAINAEIKGETIAASVFGVEETIVMVTATYDLVYAAGGSKSLKRDMVKVAALDADGEPIGTEYYIPYKELGCKNPEAANKLLGTTVKLTHKGNFAEFLAVESLTKVFTNTPDKKEVKYNHKSGALSLGGENYLAISGDYSAILNNAQGTVNGAKEVKFFKAFGATQASVSTEYVLAADGNIYNINNPFVPYAIYSALVDAWFQVVTDETVSTPNTENWVTAQVKEYKRLTPAEVDALLAKTTAQVMGFARLQADKDYHYFSAKYPADAVVVDYDYYEAIASDIDGDGDFDRVIARPYELLRINKWTATKKVDGSNTTVTFFNATAYSVAENQAGYNADAILYGNETYTATKYDTIASEDVDLYRFTGIKLDKVPNGAFVVAYISRDGVGAEKEIDIVEVIGGAKESDTDNAYVFQTYIRGYDSVTNSVIYGANYETMYIGTWAVKGTSLYDAPNAPAGNTRNTYLANTAKYVQSFWNKYVNVYVLNGAIIHIETVGDSDNYVILDAFTDFTEGGLKAMAYSTLDGGYAEVTIGELNGWSLGGYDYELFMMLKQMADLGLTVKDYPLPVALNKIYAVRSVDENGAYNLVDAGAGKVDSLYVNNFGYILGIDQNGWNDAGRVPTSDKDLWIIQTQKEVETQKVVGGVTVTEKVTVADKVVMFKGKLSAIELQNFTWYKAADNQYVAIAPVGANLGPILGNTSEGLDYWMYNQYINNYKNETLFNGFYYGHYMTNVRTGAVEFVTYDSKLAKDLFLNAPGNYIVLAEGAIYPAWSKVLKTTTAIETIKTVADLEAASKKYHAYDVAAVGAILPAGLDLDAAIAGDILPEGTDLAANSYAALRDAIALNLYAAVYGNDFTNDPTGTDVYENIIKKELLANVNFIHRTANGTYEAWVGYKSSNGTWPAPAAALGSDTTYTNAYVLYDYANASAVVFVDSKAQVEPQDAVKTTNKTIEDVVGIGDVTVTYTCNMLENKTTVSVVFANSVNAVITVDGVAHNYAGNHATFEVAGDFTGDITVVERVLTKSALTFNDEVEMTDRASKSALTTNGLYTKAEGDSQAHQWWSLIAFADNAVMADMTKAEGEEVATAPYLGALVFDVTTPANLKAFRLTVLDQGSTLAANTYRNFDILVKVGGEWKVVASEGEICGDATKWVRHAKVEGDAASVAYITYDTALDAFEGDATQIAFAFRKVIDANHPDYKYGVVVPGLASGSNNNLGANLFAIEVEAFN